MEKWMKFDNATLRERIRERRGNLRGIGSWNTTGVTDMSELFFFGDTINEPLHWDTSNVTTMRGMFRKCTAFNQPLAFDTRKVTDMSHMFRWCWAFNQPIAFDTSSVETMTHMFAGARRFNQPLEFDTRNVTDMSSMFREASAFNQPITFDTTNVKDASRMFYNATSFAQVVAFDNTDDVSDMLTGSGTSLSAADVPRFSKEGEELAVPRRYTHGADGNEFDDDDAVCQICSERAAVWGLPCGHMYCGACITEWTLKESETNTQPEGEPENDAHTQPRCPKCRARFDPQKLTQVLYFGSARRGFYMRKALAHVRAGGEAHYDRARHYARAADRAR